MRMWRISLVQMVVQAGAVEENRHHAASLLRQAAARESDVVVLPEMWTTGYALRDVDKLAEGLEGETLAMLAALAREYSVNIIIGSLPFRRDGRIYNGAFAIDRQGRVIAEYQKIHLFSLMGEERFFAPGGKRTCFTVDGVVAGMIICYDLRFPELVRALALADCQILFVPAAWPRQRGDHWRALNIARAIENEMFVCAVNCVGRHGRDTFYGHSLIIDPWGRVLAEGGEEEEIVTADIDLAEIERVRQSITVFADRRPEVY